MPDLPGRVALGYFFNAIRGAHDAGRSAAQSWGTIRQAAYQDALRRLAAQGVSGADADRIIQENRLDVPTGGIQAMNRLYAQAARALGGTRAVASAADPNAVTNDMVTLLPNARSAQERNTVRSYEAQVELRHQVWERTASRYVTIDFGSQLPPTVGQIRDEARATGEAIASGGVTGSDPLEGEYLGIGDITLWEG